MAPQARTGAKLACLHVAAAALLLWCSTAGAAVMRIGRLPATPASARLIGELAPATPLHITVALRPRDPVALQSYVRAVSTPGSLYYHGYLTPAQFARRFGASRREVRTVRDALLARGLRPGPLSAGALSLPVTATAARIERAFSVSLRRLRLSGGRTAVAASAPPALDAAAAAGVQAVIGLDSVAAPQPLLVHGAAVPASRVGLSRSHTSGPAPAPCSQAQSAASSSGAHTADQIASAYGFSPLYAAGDLGAGTTIAIYELEPVDPNDLAQYQACYGISAPISYVKVDGGAGVGAGSGESALDIEQVLGLAPRANVIVYQGQNSNSGAPGSGPYDTFRAIVDQNRAQVVSVSWGECEAMLGAANARAENNLFEQAAVQGQTIVSAAGDSGSEDCNGSSSGSPQTQLAVDDPASQPYVLGVGGTTLGTLGPRPAESVWNDGGGLITGLLQPGAGGGGISSLWPMPAAQRDAASFLNVLGAGVTGSQCGVAGGYCREIPDVAMDADPATGYLIYYNGSGSEPAQESGWQAIGGTSAAAPVWAALMALTDSSRGCTSGGPLGYVLPALYRAASTAYAADFNDVRTGNNDFTQTNGGLYAAGGGYDEASGLGSPNGAALAGTLCPDTLRIATLNAQQSAAQANVSLRLRATDVRGSVLTFTALHLPSGLSLDQATGRVSGRIRRPGTYHVIAAAVDSQASIAATRFTWLVGDATRVVGQSLTGLGSHQPTLAFTVAAGRGAPALQALDVTMPAELLLTSPHGVTLQASGPATRFSAHRTGQTLVIDLHHQLRRIRVTLSFPEIKVNTGRHPNSPTARELTLSVTDATRGTTRIRARP